MMVTSGLLSFALRWRTVLRAFQGLTAMFGGPTARRSAGRSRSARAVGSCVARWSAGTACVILGHYIFRHTWWMGVLAVLLTFVLSIVAARATGETDITPIGAMGKITQLIYGVIAPVEHDRPT